MSLLQYLRSRWHGDINILKYPIMDIRNEVYAYINNEALLRQGLTEENSPYFDIHKKMPLYDCVDSEIEFLRIGGVRDGGYVMTVPFSKDSYIAYSFGISTDVTWDMEMAGRGFDIFMYDHTIDSLPEENERFHWQKVGITGSEETHELKTLSTLLKENGHQDKKNMILKMDVEGAEWDVLAHISTDILSQFDQIVIELHDVLEYPNNPHMIKALDCLSSTHGMVHIHPNNYKRVDHYGSLVTPDVIEATFLLRDNYNLSYSNTILPREFDEPNCLEAYDIKLGRWNVE